MNQTTTEALRVETFIDSCQAIAHSHRESVYRHWISTWLNALDPKLSPIEDYELGLKLTNDSEIQQLNTDYRQKETLTATAKTNRCALFCSARNRPARSTTATQGAATILR